MGCTCDKKINCDNGTVCACGITVKFINQSTGVADESLDGYGYIDGSGDTVYQIQQSPTIFNPGSLEIIYDEDMESWLMQYTDTTSIPPTNAVTVASLSSDALCPDSKCGWATNCGYYRFQGLAFSEDFLFTWEGLYSPAPYEQYKAYYFAANNPGGTPGYWYLWMGTHPTVTQNIGPGARYILAYVDQLTIEEIESNPEILQQVGGPVVLYGYLEETLTDCADGIFVNFEPDGYPPRIFITRDDPLDGYDIEVEREECGCCDEELSVDIVDDTQTVTTYTATVETDENGNVLGHNGVQYYVFNQAGKNVYIYFNGQAWVVGNAFNDEDYVSTADGDCPFALYTRFGNPANIIQIKGVECFDCCDYYTPRFTNFIRKQRAILVDDTSYIGKKEVFGMKCGGEWEDIFRKHLIIDTLSCLPYGVLCEEEEECLIENLYKNCNC